MSPEGSSPSYSPPALTHKDVGKLLFRPNKKDLGERKIMRKILQSSSRGVKRKEFADDGENGEQGDKETKKQADKETRKLVDRFIVFKALNLEGSVFATHFLAIPSNTSRLELALNANPASVAEILGKVFAADENATIPLEIQDLGAPLNEEARDEQDLPSAVKAIRNNAKAILELYVRDGIEGSSIQHKQVQRLQARYILYQVCPWSN